LFLCCEDLRDDPYDPNEVDPVKCRAIESSLWELKVSFAHLKLCWFGFNDENQFIWLVVVKHVTRL